MTGSESKKGKKRVLILGGGVTGLTAALTLSRKGHEVTLFESEKRVGGLARTREFNGQRYDLGPHEFCTDHPSLVNFLEELLGDDFKWRHSGFSVHNKVRIRRNDEKGKEVLGQYIIRNPFSLERMTFDGNEVIYGGKRGKKDYIPFDFIAGIT